MNHRIALIGSLFACSLIAGPIFSVTGPVDTNPSIEDETASVIQFVAGAWSQSVALQNVSIDARINGTGNFVAYLTNQIGPGTTVSNQIATSMFSISSSPQSNISTIFTNLTLPAGTYYFTIAEQDANTGTFGGWVAAVNPTVTGGSAFVDLPGEAGGSLIGGIDAAYIPGSAFDLSTANGFKTFQLMDLSGTLSTPEPSSGLTLGLALLSVVTFAFRANQGAIKGLGVPKAGCTTNKSA